MTDRPTVHLVDDDPAVRKALTRVLVAAGHPCRTWESAEEFLSAPLLPADGCVVLDLALPGASGLDLQTRLGELVPGFPVVFLTGRGDIGTSVRAMKGGAVDFLTKPVEPAALLMAVEAAVARGRNRLEAHEAEAELAARQAKLTPREREVLEMVVQGRLNKQIAADLGIAEKTIKVHRARMMRKLGVRTVADLVRLVLGHRA
jgi:RNA polymerase sigma factor (sigma-70 family)